MPLHDTLRDKYTTLFSEGFLTDANTHKLLKVDAPASVLLRITALYALTYTERQFYNTNKYDDRIEELEAVPAYDAWFPCGATKSDQTVDDKETFDKRNTTEVDRIIKKEIKETYAPTEDPIKTRYYVPDVPVAINANSNAATDITKISFFDEVNSMHNWHMARAREVNDWKVQGFFNNTTALPQIINVSSNDLRSIYMSVQKTGNCEGTVVQSWGAYVNQVFTAEDKKKTDRKKITPAIQEQTFITLRRHFKERVNIREDRRTKNLRDLYRLECIREPAALLTNAMFLDLATASNYFFKNGYKLFDKTVSFDNIVDWMPMAPKKTVEKCRSLWTKLIQYSNSKKAPIYYRYDYNSKNDSNYSFLANLENNLLLYYLIYKADQLNNNDIIKTELENTLSQQNYVDIDRSYVINDNRFVNNNIIKFHIYSHSDQQNITITSFPLKILQILLFEWYYVDLDLPDITVHM